MNIVNFKAPATLGCSIDRYFMVKGFGINDHRR